MVSTQDVLSTTKDTIDTTVNFTSGIITQPVNLLRESQFGNIILAVGIIGLIIWLIKSGTNAMGKFIGVAALIILLISILNVYSAGGA